MPIIQIMVSPIVPNPLEPTIIEWLNAGRSKSHILHLLQWIGTDADKIAALMDVFFGPHKRLAELAAWAVGDLGYKQPELLKAWLPQLVEILHSNTVHDAVHRNSLRILMQSDIPENLLDSCTEACFLLGDNPKTAVAIRAFSIHILADICKKIPELWPELQYLLERHTPEGTPALKNLGEKILARIPKV
jgi:hypothetical protein